MDDDLYRWLKNESKKHGTSMAAIFRQALHDCMRRTGKSLRRMKSGNGKSCYDSTKDLCGSFRSGVPDLATNKKYMKGFGEWKRAD